MVLKSGRPGRSEFSHGKGQIPDPRSDYQSQRDLAFPIGEDKRDVPMRLIAEKRLDGTNADELVQDMYYAQGNPDAFGPGLPLVQEPVQLAPRTYKQPILRYGVDRQA